jgi:hypothetical protein
LPRQGRSAPGDALAVYLQVKHYQLKPTFMVEEVNQLLKPFELRSFSEEV